MQGIPDTTALSRPAELERFVKDRLDSATRGRGPFKPSQSITSVPHMGRASNDNRSVLVEYSSSQAKHKAYALSRELRRQGFHLSDELTAKQLQAQMAMEPDVTALRCKGYRPWFRRGALFYSNRGIPRQCKKGEALTVPQCPSAANSGAPFSGSYSPRRRDNGVTASVNAALGRKLSSWQAQWFIVGWGRSPAVTQPPSCGFAP